MMTLSKNCVLTNEPLVYSDRRTKIDCDLDGQKTVMTAVLQDHFHVVIGQPTFVIRHDGDLPGLKPAISALVLPEDLCIVGGALVLTTAGIRGRCCLARHEAIAHDFVPLQLRRLSRFRCPGQDLDPVQPYLYWVHGRAPGSVCSEAPTPVPSNSGYRCRSARMRRASPITSSSVCKSTKYK